MGDDTVSGGPLSAERKFSARAYEAPSCAAAITECLDDPKEKSARPRQLNSATKPQIHTARPRPDNPKRWEE
jgi:hypothetical protein